MKEYFYSPVGKICIEAEEDAITALYLEDGPVKNDGSDHPLLRKAGKELEEYFAGKRKNFDLSLKPAGTEFQKAVWKALREIPYGETRCYLDIAKAVANPKACRAVGGVNRQNPIMIFIPCHRVIGKDGSLTGFGGGIAVKWALLELERKYR